MPALSSRRGTVPFHVTRTRKRKPPPAPTYRPTPTQIRSSRAQARSYGSQARQISTQAKRQRKVAAKKRAAKRREEALLLAARRRGYGLASDIARYDAQRLSRRRQRGFGGASDIARRGAQRTSIARARAFGSAADYYRRHPSAARSTVIRGRDLFGNRPETIYTRGRNAQIYSTREAANVLAGAGATKEHRDALTRLIGSKGLLAAKRSEAERKARNLAPVLKAVEQLERPMYAVGGAIHGIKQGSLEKAAKGAAKGALLQERHTPGKEILGKGGGALGSAGRFLLDVGLDPTTYITLGGASVAGKTAAKAAERAAADAAKAAFKSARAAGKSSSAARKLARDAGRRQGRVVYERSLRAAERRGGKQLDRGLHVSVAGSKTARRAGRAVRKRVLTTGAEKRVRKARVAAPLVRSTAAIGRAQKRGVRQLVGAKRAQAIGESSRAVGASLHAGVRPHNLTPEEFHGVKSIRRESRAAEEQGIRQAVARANLGRNLTREEDTAIVRAIERGNLAKLKDARLRKIAKEYRDELRYSRRKERRAGITAGEVGKGARSRREVALRPRAERQITEKDLSRANRDVKRAIENRNHLRAEYERRWFEDPTFQEKGHVAERRILRNQILEAEKQVHAARERFKSLHPEAEARQRAAGQLEEARAERTAGQAKGYFPRIPSEQIPAAQSLSQRIRAPVRATRARVTKAKPQPGSSRYRKYRMSREQMAKGSETQRAVLEATEPRTQQSIGYRVIGGERGRREAIVNRQLAERFGKKLPRDFDKDKLADLRERGYSVYRVQRGKLEELGPGDLPEIQRAAKGTTARAQADLKRRAAMRAEGFTTEEIDKQIPQRSARYVVLKNDIVTEARKGEKTWDTEAAGVAWDAANRAFKTVALATPQYLVRNFAGDLFNAWTEQNALKLIANSGRSQKVLHQLGRKERALAKGAKGHGKLSAVGQLKDASNKLTKLLGPNKGTIQLTPEQAREIAGPSANRLYNLIRKGNPNLTKDQIRQQIERNLTTGKVPAIHVAMLAEQHGVVRQGRFLELMQEGRREFAGRTGVQPWQSAVKRVEDSTRLATFIGAIGRGQSVEEAARLATRVHFDYGDLTTIERQFFRRAMPFYTFPSRNIPFQAQQLVRKPGKYATLEKARQAFADTAGEDEGWESKLTQFEARQLPFPVKVGDRKYTISLGQPFTDLNDVVTAAEGAAAPFRLLSGTSGGDLDKLPDAALKRVFEALGPAKVLGELWANKSLFFREDIERQGGRLTQAPEWAVLLARTPGIGDDFRKLTGMQQVGKGPVMWRKKAEYAVRSALPGLAGAVSEAGGALTGLGAEKNARGRSQTQRIAGYLTGARIVPIDKKGAAERDLYDRRSKVQTWLENYRQSYRAGHNDKLWDDIEDAPAEYRRRNDELTRIQRKIEGRDTEEAAPTIELTGAQKQRVERARQRAASTELTGAQKLRIERARARLNQR